MDISIVSNADTRVDMSQMFRTWNGSAGPPGTDAKDQTVMIHQLEDEPSEPREPQFLAKVFTIVCVPSTVPKGVAQAIDADTPMASARRGPWRVARLHWHFTF